MLLFALLLSYLIEYGAYLQEKADETTRIQEQVIVSLAEITENKSGQTGQRVRRAAEYTRILADELGIRLKKLTISAWRRPYATSASFLCRLKYRRNPDG